MRYRTALSRGFLLGLLVLVCSRPIAAGAPGTALQDPVTPPRTAPWPTPTAPAARSTDPQLASREAGDADWSSGGPAGVGIRALVIHPTTPDIVFAGGFDGLYRTLDGGGSWQAVNAGASVTALVVDPLTPDVVYAGGWGGVLRSTDGGDTWNEHGEGIPDDSLIQTLAIDPDAPDTVYAGTNGNGVFKTVDGGSGWSSFNSGFPSEVEVHDLAVDPASTGTLYAATSEGVFKSTDGAQTWSPADEGLHSGGFRSLVVDPREPDTVYVASLYNPYYAGVYRSSDGGATWELARSGIVGADARALAIASGVLYVATDAGVFRSVDGGGRWRSIYPDHPSSMRIRALGVSEQDDPTVFIGAYSDASEHNGVWQSTLTSPPPSTVLPARPPKAVLIVGPLDAPDNEDTGAAIETMEARASSLEGYGFDVVRLYHPDATWQRIRANLTGASVVLYQGHGFGYNPDDGNYLGTGGANNGFCITDPDNLSGAALATQDMLIAHTQLAHGAVVMNFACYSAGSSASDTTVVSEEVARRRVNDYSYTFLTIGAGAYFAGGDWDHYLDHILGSLDNTAGSAYKTAPGFDAADLRAYSHTQYGTDSLWLDPSVGSDGEVVTWGSAFAGDPTLAGRTILGHDIPSLSLGPTTMTIIKEPTDPDTGTRAVRIANEGGGELRWQVEQPEASWLDVTPLSGAGPEDLTISVDTSGLAEGTYSGTVTVVGQGAVYESPQSAEVILYVGELTRTHLPLVVRAR